MKKNYRNHKLTTLLAATAVIMFGVAFALVPFFNLLCDALDLNSINQSRARDVDVNPQLAHNIDHNRIISLRFDISYNDDFPWHVVATDPIMHIKPGSRQHTEYLAVNHSKITTTIRAIPSIWPPEAAKYLIKTECFCFEQQILDPYSSAQLPIYYYINPALPDHIEHITLSYTFFDISNFQPSTPAAPL